VIWNSFRPEGDLGQTAGVLLDASRTIPACNPQCWNVLAFPLRRSRTRAPSTTQSAYGHKFPKPKEICNLGPDPDANRGASFPAQYNLEMADRIACSSVTCPKCGTWVVVRQQTESGENKRKKSRAAAPYRNVAKTSTSRLSRLGSLKSPCPFLSGAISINLNCRDRGVILNRRLPEERFWTASRALTGFRIYVRRYRRSKSCGSGG
jgi:hypothetical protein